MNNRRDIGRPTSGLPLKRDNLVFRCFGLEIELAAELVLDLNGGAMGKITVRVAKVQHRERPITIRTIVVYWMDADIDDGPAKLLICFKAIRFSSSVDFLIFDMQVPIKGGARQPVPPLLIRRGAGQRLRKEKAMMRCPAGRASEQWVSLF